MYLPIRISYQKAAGRSGPLWKVVLQQTDLKPCICGLLTSFLFMSCLSLVCAVMMPCPLGNFTALSLFSIKNIFVIWHLNFKLLCFVLCIVFQDWE